MSTQNQKIKKIKRYKKTSIAFPIIGGTLLAGGAIAGITIGLMKLPKVTSDVGTIEMTPGELTHDIEFTFKDDVQGEVHAELSGTKSNDEKEPTVVFLQGDVETRSADFIVSGDKLEATIKLTNPPTEKGDYSFLFGVTFTYNNKDGKNVEHKVDNIRINYVVEEDTLIINEPSSTAFEMSARINKSGQVVGRSPTIKNFTYIGEINDTKQLSVQIINYEQPDAISLSASIENLNTEKKTFDIAFNVTNAKGHGIYDSNTLKGNLKFVFNSRTLIEQTHEFVISLTEQVDVIEPEVAPVITVAMDDREYDPENPYYATTGQIFESKGMQDIHLLASEYARYGSLTVKPNFNKIDGIEIVGMDVTETASLENKTFGIGFYVYVTNPLLKKEAQYLSGTVDYVYRDRNRNKTTVEGTQNITIKLEAIKAIYAPDKSTRPEVIKLDFDEDPLTSTTCSGEVTIDGFAVSGYDSSEVANFNVYWDNTESPIYDNIELSVVPTIDPHKFSIKFEIDEMPIEYYGETIKGNFYFEDSQHASISYICDDPFELKLGWENNIIGLPNVEPVSSFITREHKLTVNFPAHVVYTGFDTNYEKQNVVVTTPELPQDVELTSGSVEFTQTGWYDSSIVKYANITLELTIKTMEAEAQIAASGIQFKHMVFTYKDTGSEIVDITNLSTTVAEACSIDDSGVEKNISSQLLNQTEGEYVIAHMNIGNYEEYTTKDFKYTGYTSDKQLEASWKDEEFGGYAITNKKVHTGTYYSQKYFRLTFDILVPKTERTQNHVFGAALHFAAPDGGPDIVSSGYIFTLRAADSLSDENIDTSITAGVDYDPSFITGGIFSTAHITGLSFTGYESGMPTTFAATFVKAEGQETPINFYSVSNNWHIDHTNHSFALDVTFTGMNPTAREKESIKGHIHIYDTLDAEWDGWDTKDITISFDPIGTISDWESETEIDRDVEGVVKETVDGVRYTTITYTGFLYEGFRTKADRDLLNVNAYFKRYSAGVEKADVTANYADNTITWHPNDENTGGTFDITLYLDVTSTGLQALNLSTVQAASETEQENTGIAFFLGESSNVFYRTGNGMVPGDTFTAHINSSVALDESNVQSLSVGAAEEGAESTTVDFGVNEGEHFIVTGVNYLAGWDDPRISVKANGWGEDVTATVYEDGWSDGVFGIRLTIANPVIGKHYSGKFDIYVDGTDEAHKRLTTTKTYYAFIEESTEPSIDVGDVQGTGQELTEGSSVEATLTGVNWKNLDLDTYDVDVDVTGIEYTGCSATATAEIVLPENATTGTFDVKLTFANLEFVEAESHVIGGSIVLTYDDGDSQVQKSIDLNMTVNEETVVTITPPTIAQVTAPWTPLETGLIETKASLEYAGFTVSGLTAETKAKFAPQANIIIDQAHNVTGVCSIEWDSGGESLTDFTLKIDVTRGQFINYSGQGITFEVPFSCEGVTIAGSPVELKAIIANNTNLEEPRQEQKAIKGTAVVYDEANNKLVLTWSGFKTTNINPTDSKKGISVVAACAPDMSEGWPEWLDSDNTKWSYEWEGSDSNYSLKISIPLTAEGSPTTMGDTYAYVGIALYYGMDESTRLLMSVDAQNYCFNYVPA